MSLPETPYSRLRRALEAAVVRRDFEWLRDVLMGRMLIACGGDEDPEQHLLRALELAPYDLEAVSGLGRLLAYLVEFERDQLSVAFSGQSTSTQHYLLALRSCRLAAELPAQKVLFSEFKTLNGAADLLAADIEPVLRMAFLQALLFQQVDSSLEPFWYHILETSGKPTQTWDTTTASLALEAWRGLLWIPTRLEGSADSEKILFRRVQSGLLCLATATQDNADQEEWLQLALKILFQTIPRPHYFWSTDLASWMETNSSQALQRLAIKLWGAYRRRSAATGRQREYLRKAG